MICLGIIFYFRDYRNLDEFSYQTVVYFLQNINAEEDIRRYGPRNKRRRRQQAGAGIDLSTTIDLGKKAVRSPVGQMIIKDAVNALPTAYQKIKSKITNKKAKAILNTGIDDYIVNKGVCYLGERFD